MYRFDAITTRLPAHTPNTNPTIELFSINCRKNQNQNQSNLNSQSEEKKNTLESQWELKVKLTQMPKARENAGDQVLIGFGFASYWLREKVRVLWTNHHTK